MRALLPILGIVALAFLFVSCEMLAELFTPIEGTWDFSGTITVEGETGIVAGTMDLERDGTSDVEGELTAASMDGSPYPGTLPVDFDGTIDGKDLDLDIVLTIDTQTMKLSMEGEVDGDRCEGDFTLTITEPGYSPITGTGTFTMRKD
jgi:hypothetical protein